MLLLGLKLEFFLFYNSSSRQVEMTVTFNVGPKYFVISIFQFNFSHFPIQSQFLFIKVLQKINTGTIIGPLKHEPPHLSQ